MRVLNLRWDDVYAQDEQMGMGTFQWPFGYWPSELDTPADAFLDEPATAGCGFRVVRVAGLTYCHQTFIENPEGFPPGGQVELRAEPANPHDPEAVAVIDDTTGLRYGYLPRGIDRDRVGDAPKLAGRSGWVLCHWRQENHGDGSNLPVSAHVLVPDPGLSETIEFPLIRWNPEYQMLPGRSIGPE